MFSFTDRSYIRAFKNSLDSISVEVSPPNNMAVSSDYYLTRQPYWKWLKRAAIDQLEKNPDQILNFWGLKSTPAPDVFAWYCCIFLSYRLLNGSSSCHYDGGLTQWGKYLKSFLDNLISYGVDERFIKKQSAIEILYALYNSGAIQNIPLIDKQVPSSYSNRQASSKKETFIGCGCLTILLIVFLIFVFLVSD